jgi:hypothetical protein
MEEKSFWSYFFEGATAVGTIALAILAIFGHKIRAKFIRPQLELELKNSSPFRELIDEGESSDSSASHYYQEIRIKVINNGQESARNCKIIVDSIYLQRKNTNEFFKFKEFVPKEFYWLKSPKDKATDILPKIPTFALLAKIDETLNVGAQSQVKQNTLQTYSLYILVDAIGPKGQFISIDNGLVIFPIVIYAENISQPIKKFVEIFWDGDDPNNLDDSNFDVRLLSESDGKRKLGRAL